MINSGLKIIFVFIALIAMASCGRVTNTGSESDLKGDIIIFHAGSLSEIGRAHV